jgi:hypothetical protein
LIDRINGSLLLAWKWGLDLTGFAPHARAGLFDKLVIEERETWTAELWRPCGNAGHQDFGGPVSSHSSALLSLR